MTLQSPSPLDQISPFSFMTATEIRFGRGQAASAAVSTLKFGSNILLVHGASPARSAWLRTALEKAGASVSTFAVPSEPTLPQIEQGLVLGRKLNCDVVVSLGGGAVIDAGKALAALIPARRPVMDHLEVVGKALPLDVTPLPFIAIPTTSGTGAEVTRNAVIGVPEHRRKVSIRDARMLPRLAIVDPALTDHCPRSVTLASGLDAVTQVIEPYLSTKANAFTDMICRDAIPRGLVALRQLMQAEDARARDELSWVSLCGGLALANAGLGAVHGLAGPLGGLTGAPHGAICGVLLPHILKANWAEVRNSETLQRFEDVGRWIASAHDLSCDDVTSAADALASWAAAAGLPRLSALGVSGDDCVAAAEAAASAASMKSNPVPLSAERLCDAMRASG